MITHFNSDILPFYGCRSCGWRIGHPHCPDVALITLSPFQLWWVDCCHASWNETSSRSFNVLYASKACLGCTAFFCASFRLFCIYICGILQVLRTHHSITCHESSGGVEIQLYPFMTLMRWMVIARPWPHNPPPHPLYRRLGGSQGWSRWVQKILLLWVGTVYHPYGTTWMFLSAPVTYEQWDCTVLWVQSCQFSVLLLK